jgi:hypothetical protein
VTPSTNPRTAFLATCILFVFVALGAVALAPSVIWLGYEPAIVSPPLPPPPPPLPPPLPMPPLDLRKEHQNFDDQIAEFTGPDATDCGRLDSRATAERMRAALACGLRAAKSGRPFLVIKSEYGIDSWIPHGLVRGRSGPVLRFSYDDHVPSHRVVTEPCFSPVVKWVSDFQEWKFMCEN